MSNLSNINNQGADAGEADLRHSEEFRDLQREKAETQPRNEQGQFISRDEASTDLSSGQGADAGDADLRHSEEFREQKREQAETQPRNEQGQFISKEEANIV